MSEKTKEQKYNKKEEIKSKKLISTKITKNKKTSKTLSTKKSPTVKKKKIEVVEYYDLPYKYNQTIIKLLAQTPTTLFVYWEISDKDIENFKKQYGYDFFYKTRPILIVHNDTMNYSFEVDINDFANCWYLNVTDSNCNYRIELGRKPILEYTSTTNFSEQEIQKYPSKPINSNFLHISTSNELQSPNNKVLDTNNINSIEVKNIKTNKQYSKKITSNDINKIYQKIYENEIIEDILSNPSSM